MPHAEGRAPRSSIQERPKRWIPGVIIALLAICTLAVLTPILTDLVGYERIYSRAEPDGRRFQLERKSYPWLPGPDCRCVVTEPDGERTVHAASTCEETAPEQRIRAALMGDEENGDEENGDEEN